MKHIKIRLLSSLIVMIGITFLSACSLPSIFHPKAALSYDEYLSSLFQTEITSNTLNLHYTLRNPSSYGIEKYPITLGSISAGNRTNCQKQYQKVLKELHSYEEESLSANQRFTYQLLDDYLNTRMELSEYYLYQEPLIPSNGIQAQLPILYAEYEFQEEQDVKDYLALISQTSDYFHQILTFETQKASANLFMSDSQCNSIITECESFIANPKEHYLIQTFDNKIDQLQSLSQEQKNIYKASNEKIVNSDVLPAYQTLITGMQKLMGCGRNDGGLCHFAHGKDYYKLLVYADTGFDTSIENLDEKVRLSRENNLAFCHNLLTEYPEIITQCANTGFSASNPDQMLLTLKQSMLTDFPAAPDVSCQVHYVDPSLADNLAPAFYITSPIDDYKNNHIYINSASSYPDLYYFTTLAHEGYPGHLYQTVMSYSSGISPVRSILDYPGFTEGWATYVEMCSYYYAGIDSHVAALLQHNQSATLSLYASSDIGIHYKGWDSQDMYQFWGKYGVTDHKTIDKITGIIQSDPGNYLKYYVGYLGFCELKEEAQKNYGSDFNNVKFHQTLLNMGPAPFNQLRRFFSVYWSKS